MNKKLLVVVDYQNDFVTGSLGFEKAVSLEKSICNKILAYRKNNDTIVFTLDTHTKNYMQTQEGKNLPVEHCIKGTEGVKLYGKINELVTESDHFIEKGTFGASGLADYLKEEKFISIEFVGVVSNICVISNAVIAKTTQPEALIIIDASCVASFDDSLNEKALDVMQGLQMKIINR
ncbi:MAG: isochorismatase family cysteine hydrolase [Oscillospiraceae bacterium]